MRFVSLFSGVGGFDLGLEAAGWQCVAQVEWDARCRGVLARHWPDVSRWGDVSDVSGADLPAADVVAFGSPCQDLSVAGRRAGFGGDRSVLFYEATRIVREMRDATDHAFPRFVIWENVAGALSSAGGRDFAAVLDDLADCGAVDIAWRTLDARWFGVPQRRRRVFVVADLAGHGAGAIHAEPAGVPWHPRTGATARQGTAPRVGGGVGSGGAWDLSIRGRDGGAQVEVTEELANALRAGDGGSSRSRAIMHTAACLNSGGNSGGFRSEPGEHLIAFHMTQDPISSPDVVPSISVGSGGNGVMFSENQRGEVVVHGTAHQLATGGGKPGQGYPAVLAFTAKDHGADYGDISPTLRAGTHDQSHPNGGVMPAVLTHKVRRLTPVECERLMGWPDDHTRWTDDGTEIADSHRYRMCGNGVASPVAEWLATRLTTTTGRQQR